MGTGYRSIMVLEGGGRSVGGRHVQLGYMFSFNGRAHVGFREYERHDRCRLVLE